MAPTTARDGHEKDESLLHNSPRSTWRSLFHFVTKSHYVVLTAALVFAVLSSIIMPVFAYLLGRCFNAFASYGAAEISMEEFLNYVAQQTLYMAVLGFINLGLSAFFMFFWLLFGQLQAATACRRLYSCMLTKEMEWFDMQKSGISALLPRIQSQLYELRSATSQPFGFLCQYFCTILVAVGLAFYSAWDLTLVVIASAPVGAAVLMFLSRRLQPHIKRQAMHLEVSVKHVAAAIRAIATVQCANGQEFELQQYAKSIRRARAEYNCQARLNAMQFGFIRFLTLAIFLQGFWYGRHLVSSGARDSAQILTAFWSCLIATQTFEGLLQHVLVLENGCVAGETLYSILAGNDDTRLADRASVTPSHCEGDIQFEKVSFAYPSSPEVSVLDEVTMFFAARETTFIVGKSGSGKSTLSNLLLGFYSASGKLTFDGNPFGSLDRSWLRNNITVMQQQSILFNESILRNIAFGVRDFQSVTPQDVEECIYTAALSDTIMGFPAGIHTIVGPEGNLMSGGQKQRIAFARAKLRDTPVLIFDETTSALDQEAADAIMKSIRQWRRNKTTIIITHDLSQVLEDDYVYVMDCGSIVQEGYKARLEKANDQGFRELKGPQHQLIKPISKTPVQLVSQQTSYGSSDDAPSQSSPFYAPSPAGIAKNRYLRTMTDTLATSEAPRKLSGQIGISLVGELDRKRLPTPFSSQLSLVPIQSEAIQLPQDFSLELTSSHPVKDFTKPKQDNEPQRSRSFIEKHSPAKNEQSLSLYKILSTIWSSLGRSQRVCLILGLLAAIGHAIATPVFSWVFSRLIGTYASNIPNSSEESLQWSLAVLLVAVSDGILSFCMHYLLETAGQSWVDTLREKAYKGILNQPQSWFDGEGYSSQKLLDCLNKNGEEMRNLLGRFLGLLTVAMIMMIVAVSWSLILCWKLTLVCLACGPLIYTLTRLSDSVNGRWESKCNSIAQSIGESFAETFGNIFTVRALTLEDYFHCKNTRLVRQATIAGVRRATYSGILFGTSDTAILLVIALLFWYSSQLIVYQRISVQTILTVLSMLLFTLTSIISTITFIPQLKASQDMAGQLLHLVNLKDQTSQDYTRSRKPFKLEGNITVSNLNFVYPSRPQQAALKDVSLVIPLESSTAIIGPSGSGKSTLISLLLGLYTPVTATAIRIGSYTPVTATAIRIGSYPLSKINISTLRRFIALSPQDPPIFPTSIKANIAYALPVTSGPTSMSNIIKAAKLAGLHSFISSLPEGYSTLIGEGGSLLSGGQTARLGLARAICRQPRILILDEPTAGLDGLGRTELIAVVQKLVQAGVTVVVATHDPALRNGCQHVVELKLQTH